MAISRRDFMLHGVGAVAAGAVFLPRATMAQSLGHRLAEMLAHTPGNQPARPRPTPSQLMWQRDELAMFLHFGINTFTDREWGDGKELPAQFTPPQVDTDQWARVARASGFRTLVLTAKHHDGFCLWPTRTTAHSVASSPWKGGRGDVVRDLAESCRKYGLRLGLYCSPWDRNHPAYGDSPRYNEVFRAQLNELLTWYGPLHEVWFDGANGEGPNGKRQVYDWPETWALVRRLQPNAVIFSDAGPDVRWIGNERGVAGQTNWSTIRSSAVPFPGADGPEIIKSLQEGHEDGDVWRPGETDVSIRPGWFHHPAEDARVKTVEQLVDIYFTSVGRNSKLLLNVPPTRDGRLHAVDVERLGEMRRELDETFGSAQRVRTNAPRWEVGTDAGGTLTTVFTRPSTVGIVDLREDVKQGQRVAEYVVEALQDGEWKTVIEASTIGYRTMHRIAPVMASAMRLRVTRSLETPMQPEMQLYQTHATNPRLRQ